MTAKRDQRRDRRYDVRVQVACSASGLFVSARATNVSRGGLFVPTAHPFPLHSKTTLTLSLPEPFATVRAKGLVMWVQEAKKGTVRTARTTSGMGIRFTDMSTEDRVVLEKYLNTLR
jgi:uncharacterized protein (TIGR02266 family)